MKEIRSQKLIEKYSLENGFDEIFKDGWHEHAKLFSYDRGEYLCEEENPFDYLLLMVKGKVKVFTTQENGKVFLINVESSPNSYGDLELFKKETFSANAQAVTELMVIGVERQYVEKEHYEYPPFLRFMKESLGRRLNNLTIISTQNLTQPLKVKLAGYLLLHMDESDTIKLFTSMTDVADHLGATYRHVSRTFAELEEIGLISKKGKRIQVLDRQALAELAGDMYNLLS